MAKKISDNIEVRSGLNKESLREDIKLHIRHTLAKDEYSRTQWDEYRAVVLTIMDRLHDKWITTQQKYHFGGVKRVYYLSMEYLIGHDTMTFCNHHSSCHVRKNIKY